MEEQDFSKIILGTLTGKSTLKQNVSDAVLEVFRTVKDVLSELTSFYNDQLAESDKRLWLEYQDNGMFGAQVKVASDILIVNMHSNVFQFDREHNIWKVSYASSNPSATYCGIINIYNFLSDSFKYNRKADLGYLISRIFVNKDKQFFVEGKRQQKYHYTIFGQQVITKDILKEIINTAISYALEFDLLVPPYDTVKLTTVEKANLNIEYSKMETGKRLGFSYNSDDISG